LKLFCYFNFLRIIYTNYLFIKIQNFDELDYRICIINNSNNCNQTLDHFIYSYYSHIYLLFLEKHVRMYLKKRHFSSFIQLREARINDDKKKFRKRYMRFRNFYFYQFQMYNLCVLHIRALHVYRCLYWNEGR